MLVRDEWESPFPDNDLTYLGFLAGAWQILESLRALRRDSRNPPGALFLAVVPLLEDLPGAAQRDILAETWARHRCDEVHPASLLGRAVLYAPSRAGAGHVR